MLMREVTFHRVLILSPPAFDELPSIAARREQYKKSFNRLRGIYSIISFKEGSCFLGFQQWENALHVAQEGVVLRWPKRE